MNAFDQAMNALDDKFSFLSSSKQIVSDMNEEKKIIVFERGDLVFVFNFHPSKTYDGYKVGCDLPGKYKVALDSDALMFGGHGRVWPMTTITLRHLKEYQEYLKQTSTTALTHSKSCLHPALVWLTIASRRKRKSPRMKELLLGGKLLSGTSMLKPLASKTQQMVRRLLVPKRRLQEVTPARRELTLSFCHPTKTTNKHHINA
uniref:Alpha-amylase/branching enzyme C-terminal all beta domain-containing protein n=1 Tax=Aegilops tauschii subsp. strangulata TaxID=200361 RepID=A0A453TAT2_AEGTS